MDRQSSFIERRLAYLKIAVKGKKIEGYLYDKKNIDYTYERHIEGRIGLWSKADSYVFFNHFLVELR